mgnify:CR=1 FL=1
MRKPKYMPYLAVAASLLVLGCASVDGVADIDALTAKMVQTSFRDQGIAKVDRLQRQQRLQQRWRHLQHTDPPTLHLDPQGGQVQVQLRRGQYQLRAAHQWQPELPHRGVEAECSLL